MKLDLGPLRYHRHLVYLLPKEWVPKPLQHPDAELVWADSANVRQFFQHDAKLERRFLEFLTQGCIGLFFVLDGCWVAYAWMTLPKTALPAHLPPAPFLDASWIFHCRTKEPYQGRGLYKRAITLLACRAHAEGMDVYIDTQPDNLPSRSAITSVGFQLWGSFRVWAIHLPGCRVWCWGNWQPAQSNPTLLRFPAGQNPSTVARRLAKTRL